MTAPARTRSPRVTAVAHPGLRPLLARPHTGFADGATPRRFAIPAAPAVAVVVRLGESAHRPPAFVKGPDDAFEVPPGRCAPTYAEAWLAPPAAYAVLGTPLEHLRGLTVDLADLLGRTGREIADRMHAEPTWSGRFALLDRLLLRRIADGPRPAPEVAHAWRRLVGSGGRLPIRLLAEETGWSHKHLITMFRRQVGLPPRTAARLVRFDGVLRRVERPDRPAWEQVAADSGYADQSHLVRDFRAFAGTTPTGFVREVNRVQDAR
ncbi:MAG: helix-turn-helix domain-containing protein [Pseudonocardia sp.]